MAERTKYGLEDLVLIGRPFASIGMGELLRVSCRAFREARVPFRVLDIYGMDEPDADTAAELGPSITSELGRINIFHLNGDEIEGAQQRLSSRVRRDSYNIIYPTWELPKYPACWARSIDGYFDEVWACSEFVRDSITSSVSVPVRHMPLAVQPRLRSLLSRRYFGIPETSYVFLFFFDFTSYIERKNPFASLSAFERLLRQRPNADVHFVVKLNNSKTRPADLQRFMDFVQSFQSRVTIIDRTLTNNEVKNLHLCCDTFVSLHRSEGFGLCCAEAMFFGRPVIATAYSGNLDLMTSDTAILIDYRLVRVPVDAYPHSDDQVWADPDIEQAVRAMIKLVDDSAFGLEIGRRASSWLRTCFNNRAVGLRYEARLQQILKAAPPRSAQRQIAVSAPTSAVALKGVTDVSDTPLQLGAATHPTSTTMESDVAVSKTRLGGHVALPDQHGEATFTSTETTETRLSALDTEAVSDEAWLGTLIAAAEGRSPLGQHLPPFPAPEWQIMFVGSSNATAMREAFTFYLLLKRLMARNGRPIERKTRVLDFGCGWGRYIRLLMKDVGAGALHGADVDPDMIGFCRISGLPARFAVMPPLGPTEYPDGTFDLIFAYSVFSHLSEEAYEVWMREFVRILRPGGLIVFTTQARRFLEWTAELRGKPEAELTDWHKSLRFAFPDLEAVLADYNAGRFVFAPTGGGEHRPSSFYGEAAIPEGYLRRMKPDGLRLLEFIDDVTVCPQAVAVLRRAA